MYREPGISWYPNDPPGTEVQIGLVVLPESPVKEKLVASVVTVDDLPIKRFHSYELKGEFNLKVLILLPEAAVAIKLETLASGDFVGPAVPAINFPQPRSKEPINGPNGPFRPIWF
ncbi:unnamed protein product [Linum tenue]|uniref:Uncharacterized protein n=1 Tax=Linum tenue TaxID=586396 RepID=A0AAV0L3G8_9ROSI|nr:unnamed protein product [Linum tenue]